MVAPRFRLHQRNEAKALPLSKGSILSLNLGESPLGFKAKYCLAKYLDRALPDGGYVNEHLRQKSWYPDVKDGHFALLAVE
jgi:hypothetical protein